MEETQKVYEISIIDDSEYKERFEFKLKAKFDKETRDKIVGLINESIFKIKGVTPYEK
jgi:hypothetical protein